MIYILLLVLCILLFIAWIVFNKDICAPAFVFCFSFVFSVIWAVAYKNTWDLNLGVNTFAVIAGGVLLFLSGAWFIHILLKSKRKLKIGISSPETYIEKWKLYMFIIFEISVIFITFRTIKIIMRAYGASSLSNAIFLYRSLSLNGNFEARIPSYLVLCRTFVSASGYWFAYIAASKFILKKKIPFLEGIVIILAMINSVSLGGRNGLINMFISLIVCAYFIAVRNNEFKLKIKFKDIMKGIIFAIVVLILFQNFGTLLGRTTNASTTLLDYLAKYCGAEIKNLDIFLNETSKIGSSHYNQTFIYMVHWIGGKLGAYTDYVLDLPYQKINGFNLGNVYTTFYPFIYDYGYIGVIVLTLVMGMLSQISYEFAKRYYSKSISIFSIVLYAYIFNSLFFSFFSNKFYEQQFTAGFYRMIVFWILFDIFFFKVKFKINGTNINRKVY